MYHAFAAAPAHASHPGTLNVLNTVLGMWSSDMGIDLDEPSVVAVSRRTGQVLSVGADARKMLGRTPADIVAMRPMKDGVIADFDHTEQMIKHFIAKVHERDWHVSRPRIILGIPSGVTEVERRAVLDAASSAGAREAHLVEEC